MKYVLVLIMGLLTGAVILAAGVIYNPFVGRPGVSPLAVTDARTMTLQYAGVPANNIVFTNDGMSRIAPHPEKVLQLWEAPIRQTSAMTTLVRDSRNQVAGIGIKFSSLSEQTRILKGEAIVDSVWYMYLPGKGGLFVTQNENRWHYLRDIIFPAYRHSTNTWKGSWLGNITSGPGSLGTAVVSGSSGEFAGKEMLGVESISIRAWSADSGPVFAEGSLTIELLPEPAVESSAAAESEIP